MENWSDFFNLSENPFGETPDTRFFYCSVQHRAALEQLAWMIGEGKGFALLSGDVGTGKTLLCRMLLKSLRDRANTALIIHPILSAAELLTAIAEEFKAPLLPGVARTPRSELDRLNQFLVGEAAKRRKSILLIDDAQRLGADALELVRILSNLETETEKLLHIILVSQPELQQQIMSPELRQLGQRIAVNPCLMPMDERNTELYIRHRIECAGGANYLRFHPKALRRIHQESLGVPRVINRICEGVVLTAEQHRVRLIELGLVKDVLQREGAAGGIRSFLFSRRESSPR